MGRQLVGVAAVLGWSLVVACSSDGDPVSGASEGAAVLDQLAGHESPRVRAAALDAAARLGDDRITPRVVAALGDGSSLVRGAAALALFRLDGRRYDHERHVTEEQLVARCSAPPTSESDPEA